MSDERPSPSRGDLLAPLSVGCAVGSVLLIGGVTWFAGGQHSVITQWQFVLVAAGLGPGLALLAGVLHVATRRRAGEERVEAALARLLQAAGQLRADEHGAAAPPRRTGPGTT